jgi:hypothetical protein
LEEAVAATSCPEAALLHRLHTASAQDDNVMAEADERVRPRPDLETQNWSLPCAHVTCMISHHCPHRVLTACMYGCRVNTHTRK